ncbi:MAG: hypothetical protein QW230_00415 [Thermofilum sp.]
MSERAERAGIWRAVQITMLPTAPIPYRYAVAKSALAVLLGLACASPIRRRSAMSSFTSVLETLCNITENPMCNDAIEHVNEKKHGDLCTIAMKLAPLAKDTAPEIELPYLGILLAALAASLLRVEEYAPIIEELKPEEETEFR